jgi:hypothetical protein
VTEPTTIEPRVPRLVKGGINAENWYYVET